jgi:hypothetical protein
LAVNLLFGSAPSVMVWQASCHRHSELDVLLYVVLNPFLLEAGMAYWAVTLIIIAFAGIYGCLRLAIARARERAGLPAPVRVKLPFYFWALFVLLAWINAASLFSHSHGAP